MKLKDTLDEMILRWREEEMYANMFPNKIKDFLDLYYSDKFRISYEYRGEDTNVNYYLGIIFYHKKSSKAFCDITVGYKEGKYFIKGINEYKYFIRILQDIKKIVLEK
jgi:hypothetical protein